MQALLHLAIASLGVAAQLAERAPPPECGNDIVEAGEQCDDGNTTSGDGCSSSCTVEVLPPACDEELVDDTDECDDSGVVTGYRCSPVCMLDERITPRGSPARDGSPR